MGTDKVLWPVRELLIASHILPWRDHEAERFNVRNGICLNRLHDAAFDQGFIGFDFNFSLIPSTRLKLFLPNEAVVVQFEAYEGKSLALPDDAVPPDPQFLGCHRTKAGLP
jgi:putative restriction endonuclease